ncbi:hypothetical protein [Thiocapsa sp.]|uniref:hypothetical protein n=1 Tax=Thiocapsa sp. TaxID=2024551 RepID=UPI002C795CB6|nr:hypothetical protein [Thiocapsa sp.]HSO83703.1 hypothetical protein [Thiocapsa sp.]
MKNKRGIGALIGAMAIAASAAAQDTVPADPTQSDAVMRMHMAVNTLVGERIKDLLQPGDVLRLLVVARQEGFALNCDGYQLDREKLTAVMNDIVSDHKDSVEPNQNNLAVDLVMRAYGIALGGQTALAAYDRDAFCARGEDVRKELAQDSEGRMTVLTGIQ